MPEFLEGAVDELQVAAADVLACEPDCADEKFRDHVQVVPTSRRLGQFLDGGVDAVVPGPVVPQAHSRTLPMVSVQ